MKTAVTFTAFILIILSTVVQIFTCLPTATIRDQLLTDPYCQAYYSSLETWERRDLIEAISRASPVMDNLQDLQSIVYTHALKKYNLLELRHYIPPRIE